MLWLWALLIMVQDAAATLLTRATTSNSPLFHAVTSAIYNSIWFASLFILVGPIYHQVNSLDRGVEIGAIYVVANLIGGVPMHFISMRWLEKGKRRIGS